MKLRTRFWSVLGSLSLVLVIAGLLAPPAYATVPKGSFAKDNAGSGSINFSGCSGGADGNKTVTVTKALVTISAPDSMGYRNRKWWIYSDRSGNRRHLVH